MTNMENFTLVGENLTQEFSDLKFSSSYFRRKLIPSAAILAFYLLTGICGNILILYVHLVKMTRNDNRYFITILSGVNLAACCVTNVFFFTQIYFNLNYPSDWMCKSFLFLTVFFVMESAWLIVMITIHRYLKLCRPHHQQMNDKHKKIAMFLSVVISIATGFPCFYSSGLGPISGHLNITGEYCWIRSKSFPEVGIAQTTTLAILLGSCFLLCCVLYRKIGKVLIRLSVKRRERLGEFRDSAHDQSAWDAEFSFIQSQPSNGYTERRRQRPIHVNFYRMFLTMFCTYVLVFIPTLTLLVVVSHFDQSLWLNVDSAIDINVIHILQNLFIFKFSADPVIYGYFDIDFRQKIVELFRRRS